MWALYFFIGILILLFLITLHELGHFIVSKIFKVYIYEFSIGIGPKIISWKGKETRYSIRLFPIGGYIYPASEFMDPPDDFLDVEIPENRYLERINKFKRIFIIISGVLTNFFIAVAIFTISFTSAGYSPNDINGYGATYYSTANSPADVFGLNNKDKKDPYYITDIYYGYFENIPNDNDNKIKIDGDTKEQIEKKFYHLKLNNNDKIINFYQSAIKINSFLNINKKDKIKKNKCNTIWIKYNKFNHLTKKLSLKENKGSEFAYYYNSKTQYKINDNYIIGMKAPNFYFASRLEGYFYGWKKTFEESISILKAFSKIFTFNFSNLSGPIGAFEQSKNFIQSGGLSFLIYIAILSSNLFILNLIPIPPLDGFRFLIVVIEAIIRKPINDKIKKIMIISGALLFFILLIILTIQDLL